MWKNIIEPHRPQMTIWRMRIACWIPKATNTHSEYAILIAFPLQQWLHERTSVFPHMYIVCLSCTWFLTKYQRRVDHIYEPRRTSTCSLDWKKQLKGRHFSSDEEVIAAAETWLDGQHSEFFFLCCLEKLEQRAKKCIELRGEYVE